jgi:hypothetical protein
MAMMRAHQAPPLPRVDAYLEPQPGVKHFGPFWSTDHYMYGKEPWILSRVYGFALSTLMVFMCYMPFSFAHDFGWIRNKDSTPEFPASAEMGLCDKISSVCFANVLFSFAAAYLVGLAQLIPHVLRRRQPGDAAAGLELVVGLSSLMVRVAVMCGTFLPIKYVADALYRKVPF